jgi:hypothetical protein
MSFISSISIRALSTSDRTKRAEMFYLEQIPLTQRTNLNLQTSISELKEIMQNETFDIEIRLQIRGFVPVGLTLQLDFGYIAFFN